MTNSKTVATIKDLALEGKNIKYIRAFLTMEGLSDKEASALLIEADISGKRSSFANDFYDFLAEAERSEEEVEAFIMDDSTSANVKSHKAHYSNIADLARRIWAA